MIIKESPKLAEIYTQRIIDLVEGRREMQAIQYDPEGRKKHIHASDLDGLCPLPSYYSRVIPNPPPLDPQAAMKFLRGRVIERAIAQECPPIERDGIWCTVDDIYPEWIGLVEIKSTAQSCENFDFVRDCPQWVTRMKTYCYAYGEKKIGLVVFFLVGNMPSYSLWNLKDKSLRREKYTSVNLRAWEVRFKPHELKENWIEMLARKEKLEEAIKKGKPFPPEYVRRFLPVNKEKSGEKAYWQCRGCRFKEVCYFFQEYVKEKDEERS